MKFKHLILVLFILTLDSACQSVTQTAPSSPTSSSMPSPELTATPDPSPIPTATTIATLVPAPRDFTEDFNGIPPYWTIQQIDNGNPFTDPSADAGFLVFNLSAQNQWGYDLYSRQDYQNVRVDAQAEIRAGDGATGVICRYNEKNGWYEFNIYSDQTYMLLFGQWLSQGVAQYTPLFHSGSEKIKSGANEVGLSCSGDILTPYINGVQMRKWEEMKFGLTQGGVGISVSSFNNVPATIAFDWVKVSEP